MTISELINALQEKISAKEINENTPVAIEGLYDLDNISVIDTIDGPFVLLESSEYMDVQEKTNPGGYSYV
jgi:hypothetical protein